MKAFLSIVVVGGGVALTVIFRNIGIIMFIWSLWLCITSAVGMLTESSTGETGHFRTSSCRVIFLAALVSYLAFMCLTGMENLIRALALQDPLSNPFILFLDLFLGAIWVIAFLTTLIRGIDYLFFARRSREWDQVYAEKQAEWRRNHPTPEADEDTPALPEPEPMPAPRWVTQRPSHTQVEIIDEPKGRR